MCESYLDWILDRKIEHLHNKQILLIVVPWARYPYLEEAMRIKCPSISMVPLQALPIIISFQDEPF